MLEFDWKVMEADERYMKAIVREHNARDWFERCAKEFERGSASLEEAKHYLALCRKRAAECLAYQEEDPDVPPSCREKRIERANSLGEEARRGLEEVKLSLERSWERLRKASRMDEGELGTAQDSQESEND